MEGRRKRWIECSNTEFHLQSRQQDQTLHYTRSSCNQNRKSTVLIDCACFTINTSKIVICPWQKLILRNIAVRCDLMLFLLNFTPIYSRKPRHPSYLIHQSLKVTNWCLRYSPVIQRSSSLRNTENLANHDQGILREIMKITIGMCSTPLKYLVVAFETTG